MEVVVIFSLLLVLAATIIATKVVNWVWVRPRRLERRLRQQGLEGNPYQILFGDVKQRSYLIERATSKTIGVEDDIVPRVAPLLQHTLDNHGTCKDYFTWFGPTPTLTITNQEDVKEILTKLDNFRKPQLNPLVKLLVSGLFLLEDEKWATHRKIINPAFHMEKLKGMLPALYMSITEMLNKWESLVNVDGQESCEIDVWPYLQNMTGNVISCTAFGRGYEDGRRIFQLFTELGHLVAKIFLLGYFPGWRFMPTKLNNRLKAIDKEIQGLLKDMINDREKAIKSGEAPNNDLLGILMDSNQREINDQGNKKNVGMSIKEVIEECKLFYFAGQETTSVLLAWTMVLLSYYSGWQDRARQEVLKVFGNNKPDSDGLVHLKVVTMILYEVLRLFPPLSELYRVVQNETQLGRLCLPAGVLVSLPIILIHRDTELWGEDAKEFKPERFAGGVSEATKGKLSFLPFGWGPRICIGQNFAMIEAKLAIALILQRFTFELSPSYSHAPMNIITLQPQHGVHLILRKN